MGREYVMDRLEGGMAVLVAKADGSVRDVRPEELPAGAQPGMTLVEEGGAWRTDEEDAARRAERIREKMGRLFARRPGQ